MKHVEDFKVEIKNAIDEKLKEMGLVVKYSIKLSGYNNISLNIKSSKIDFKDNIIKKIESRIERLENINPSLHEEEILALKYELRIINAIDPDSLYNREIKCPFSLSYSGRNILGMFYSGDALEVLEMIYDAVDKVIKDWHEPDERVNYLNIPFRFNLSIGDNKGGYIVK